MSRKLALAAFSLLTVMALSACVSGTKPPDTYVGKNGKTTIIESDREMCERSCNDTYSRCMESTAAENNSGVNGPSGSGILGPTGMFGASAECRSDLQRCLPACKAQ
jgi:hypothetical protein